MIDKNQWHVFTDLLRGALQLEWQSNAAQVEMAPLPDLSQRFDKEKAKQARQSAVLILLYPEEDQVRFPLIVRPEYPGVHSGQIALPGGKYEEQDADLIETALREAQEEIGIEKNSVEVLGQLSDLYVPPSNFNILPVVGALAKKPEFLLQASEVDELVLADLAHLNYAEKRKRTQMTFYNGLEVEVPYFDIEGKVVWGATAMILSEFATIINHINSEK